MRYLGLDVGTTSLSAAIIDTQLGTVLATKSLQHQADLTANALGAHLQDANRLVDSAVHLISNFLKTGLSLAAIGVTGQMHGIVYVDREGKAVSPLYTWLDRQAEFASVGGRAYDQLFYDQIGKKVPVGYGALTHFTQFQLGHVPRQAVSFCTIPDYLVMRLCGLTHPVTDPTLAHSIGLFDLDEGTFLEPEWDKLIGSQFKLPALGVTNVLGEYAGVPVVTAIGDNQASFNGSVKRQHDSVLMTLGTSGQLTCLTQDTLVSDIIENRPYSADNFLLVGASLSGGKAFQLLAALVDEISVKLTGKRLINPYEYLDVDLGTLERPYLQVDTSFAGTRDGKRKSGSISAISLTNFSLEHLSHGFAQGIVNELFEFWQEGFSQAGAVSTAKRIVGSGNLLRSSHLIRQLIVETFSLPLVVPSHIEEAAVGAAIAAAAVMEQEPLEALIGRVVSDSEAVR